MHAYTAGRIFTGDNWIENHAVLVANGQVTAVLPSAQLPAEAVLQSFPGKYLVPAFIDAQVYGAGGKLFSVHPDPLTLQDMQQAFRASGTVLFQPTMATNTMSAFRKGIDAVRAYWDKGGTGVHGLHLEGPWLNPKKAGAHVSEWMHAPTPETVASLLDYGRGVVTMLTLAPELCSPAVWELLQQYDVVLSAGHSNASFEEATASFDKGITAVTHLFNAMSPLEHRAPGLAGATLSHPRVFGSIIPDGHHLRFEVVRLAQQLMKDRLFAITDAVTETTEGPYQHSFAGDRYECNGTLSGSAISMFYAFRNLYMHCGIALEDALRMCSLYPARALRIDNRYGKIAPQYRAQFLVLTDGFELADVIT